ncbi:hypothetical protein SRHO_G00139900 [Serrasalmus rhombeus]
MCDHPGIIIRSKHSFIAVPPALRLKLCHFQRWLKPGDPAEENNAVQRCTRPAVVREEVRLETLLAERVFMVLVFMDVSPAAGLCGTRRRTEGRKFMAFHHRLRIAPETSSILPDILVRRMWRNVLLTF